MFGKLGRSGGAGRGSGKRPLSTPVQLHRPGEAGGARLPIGSSAPARSRPGPQAMAACPPGREETFSLEPGELDFGAIIRLTPDIVEEIRRLEAQGGAAKIKFDANANNSAGNVVEVGGKEFTFTWSRELPDLCDIYEERRNGDDGDGLLVECGAAWRKLNVQRILDESTKNHVKMRSEEAERMLKSRKAIVLDPTNPSVKSQAKSMAAAAVEGNMRRMGWKHKKEMFFKKRKVENNQGAAAVSQTKSVSKSATASNGNFKGIPSPVPSPQQPRPRTLLSTSGTGNALRGDSNNPGEITPPLNLNKGEIDIFEKEMPTRIARGSMQDINGYDGGHIDPLIDLRSMLITLLSQNPKGMSLKALEKAVGERIPNSVKKIENVLKNIAMFQAPGRYFLKQGGQVESSKRSSEGGSSPECLNKQTPRAASLLSEKAIVESLDQETLNSKHGGPDLFERIKLMQDTEDPLDTEGKARGNSVVKAGSSSESGSDSDSESDSSSGSDSGSQSRSRSKSRSPAGSGSASSSGSESDGSSSSKEASDIDVDIMTSDDEKEVAMQRMDATVSKLSQSPGVWRSDGEYDINDNIERDQKANVASLAIDLTDSGSMYEKVNLVTDAKNLRIDKRAKSFERLEAKTVESIDSYLQESKSRSSVDGIQFSKDHNKVMENQHASPFVNSLNDGDMFFGRKAFNENQTLKDGTGEQPDNRERVPKASTKRSSNSEYLQEKSENAKRMKALSSADSSFGKEKGARSSENLCYLSPERPRHMDPKIKMTNNHQKDEKKEVNLPEGNLPELAKSAASGSIDRVQSSPDFRAVANLAAEQSSRKVVDFSGRKKNFDMEKSIKYAESLGRGNKSMQTVCGPPESDTSSLKNMPVDRISTVKGKPDENSDTLDKYRAKIAKEIFVGEKTLSAPDQLHRKSIDGYISHLHNSDMNGRGNVLRRELSDLELGEFREPLTDGMGEDKRKFERHNSFKKTENRVTVSEANAADINLGKCDGNAVLESKRQSPNSFREGMNGKVSNDSLDLSRSQSRLVQAQSRQSSRLDVTEPETMTHLDKCAESSGKNGTRTDQVVGSENEASGPKKSAATRMLKDDNRHDGLVDSKNVKETKSRKSNGLKGSTDRGIDAFLTYNGLDSRKSLELSSDEENAPYMKYEKDELGLQGPIKDLSMYKDFVREYQKRYSHYCSLNNKLETNRDDFRKVGDDIELAKGGDMGEYYNLVGKLRQMYHQRGERHKEMKRIFFLLHEELKILKQRIRDFIEAHSGE